MIALVCGGLLYLTIRTRDVAPDVAGRVVPLLESLASNPAHLHDREELSALLQGEPVYARWGASDDLDWFDQAAAPLQVLIFRDDTAVLVEWFFHRFYFALGAQQKPLMWLHNVLVASLPSGSPPRAFATCAELLLRTSSGAEARWLYDRVLDAVQRSDGAPDMKALAVRIGRRVYSFHRADRVPTIYDEQAIANDIAARVRTH
ncbi:MAG: hypothetical protein M3Q69_14600 [Acidobacteriota bacterium]|nr:hypothetical protein [Acidobacteriota bacterium]